MITNEKSVTYVLLEDLVVAQVAASVPSPLVAINLIDSCDYDGDGFLAAGEVMGDRIPHDGIEGVVGILGTEMPPGMFSSDMKSMAGIASLLR